MAVDALTPAVAPANTVRAALNSALGRAMTRPAAGDPLAYVLTLAALMPRQGLEAAIDAMIDALDAEDGNADCEDDNEDCCAAGDDDPTRSSAHWENDGDIEPWVVTPEWSLVRVS